MSLLAHLNIGKRLLMIGAASLAGLVLVVLLAVGQLGTALNQSFSDRTRQAVDVAYSQLDRFHAEEVAGRMTRGEAQAAAQDAIRAMRFGEKDYFFILDNKHEMVMHPVKPELVGQSVADNPDASGKYHFREMVQIATGEGAGLVSYDYEMPDGSGSKQKISYVRGFQPWGWVVATGVFNTEIAAAVNEARMKLLTVVAIVLVVMAGLIWVISSSITGPLGKITARMRTLAEGDTQAAIPGADRRDEIGAMAGALQVFRDDAVAKAAAEAEKAKADADQSAVVALLSDRLHSLSEGDLTRRIEEQVPAAYAALRNNFNTAIDKLRELIMALADASRSIESGSTEIAAASDDLARRTESNAASLEETSAAVSQMNARLRSTAEAAGRTAECTQLAMGTVSSGRSTAVDATGAMNRVSDSAQGIDDVIEGLDKIAFQTRVLAMNAAVEAGRAGEAGRGFAVVADLVSALAMRAEEEAKRAGEQLSTTQAEIRNAVSAVSQVDSALAQITESVEQVHQLVDSMANDNRAQAATIDEIATSLNMMDQSTQQNAAMVEQTSAAARNLAGEVVTLTQHSSRFTVGTETQRKASSGAGGKPKAKPASHAPSYAEPSRLAS